MYVRTECSRLSPSVEVVKIGAGVAASRGYERSFEWSRRGRERLEQFVAMQPMDGLLKIYAGEGRREAAVISAEFGLIFGHGVQREDSCQHT